LLKEGEKLEVVQERSGSFFGIKFARTSRSTSKGISDIVFIVDAKMWKDLRDEINPKP